MTPVRLGAVSYLNTKPLVHGLDKRQGLFSVRFDIPARCATLLHEGQVDLGLIPAIEYLRGEYAIVPDIAIASDGPIASVAVFTRVPIDRVRTLALDASSRTSVALTRILCAKRWHIAPVLTVASPDLESMLATADAALLIGDLALEADAKAHESTKIDLGEEWRAQTRLPFVYAMWTGRPTAVSPLHCEALQAARDEGLASLPAIAELAGEGDPKRADRALHYLRDNLKYGLGEAETAGLRQFHQWAVELGLMPDLRPLRFYD